MTKVDTPIKIGAYTIKNRMTFAPTVKFDYTDESGAATTKHIDHYTDRAKGGCGLICVEATAITPGGRFGKNHMGLWEDTQIEGHKEITAGCHQYGAWRRGHQAVFHRQHQDQAHLSGKRPASAGCAGASPGHGH